MTEISKKRKIKDLSTITETMTEISSIDKITEALTIEEMTETKPIEIPYMFGIKKFKKSDSYYFGNIYVKN